MLKDHSFSCLAGQTKIKSEKIFNVLGDLDELISVLGLTWAFTRKKTLQKTIIALQDDLIKVGGFLAGNKIELPKTVDLEKKIKKLKNPRTRCFSRPGVNKVSSFLHLSRTICRRLERRVVSLKQKRFHPGVEYLNRLSLYLFWLAKDTEKK